MKITTRRLFMSHEANNKEVVKTRLVSWRSRLQRFTQPQRIAQEGKIGYILLWLLGIPIPILVVIYLLRGCT